jgi:hypothetical protein
MAVWLVASPALLGAAPAVDDVASNVTYVSASTSGRCYARSVPKVRYGATGVTRIYAVGDERDALLGTYAWYSRRVYLECSVAGAAGTTHPSVIRVSDLLPGRRANREDLAIAFYYNGRLARRYSTLELAGSADRVARGRSHYRVIERVAGFAATTGNRFVFTLRTSDGRTLAFDPTTGALIRGDARGERGKGRGSTRKQN